VGVGGLHVAFGGGGVLGRRHGSLQHHEMLMPHQRM
jgi:hypothetical protein